SESSINAFRLRRSLTLRASQRAAVMIARKRPGPIEREERIFRAGIVKFELCMVILHPCLDGGSEPSAAVSRCQII
ncbi:hypothetical protein ACCS96_35835, partial [Rhizobium ruizarguesonis]